MRAGLAILACFAVTFSVSGRDGRKVFGETSEASEVAKQVAVAEQVAADATAEAAVDASMAAVDEQIAKEKAAAAKFARSNADAESYGYDPEEPAFEDTRWCMGDYCPCEAKAPDAEDKLACSKLRDDKTIDAEIAHLAARRELRLTKEPAASGEASEQ